jgi:hypothetical protein
MGGDLDHAICAGETCGAVVEIGAGSFYAGDSPGTDEPGQPGPVEGRPVRQSELQMIAAAMDENCTAWFSRDGRVRTQVSSGVSSSSSS